MRKETKTLCIATIMIALTSCYGSKETYLNDWQNLAARTEKNYSDFTQTEWDKVNAEFKKLQNRKKHFNLTVSEKVSITKAQAKIIMLETKEQGTSVLGDIKEMMDIGTETVEDFLKSLLKF